MQTNRSQTAGGSQVGSRAKWTRNQSDPSASDLGKFNQIAKWGAAAESCCRYYEGARSFRREGSDPATYKRFLASAERLRDAVIDELRRVVRGE